MDLRPSRIPPGKLFPWIFHLVLWTVWIGLPFFNTGDNEKFVRFSIWMLPLSFGNIPLFLINSEWLIPKVFRLRGVSFYLLSLLLLIAGWSFLSFSYKEWVVPAEVLYRGNGWFWVIIPVVFVTAISTGYGLLVYLQKEEKMRQEEKASRLASELSFLRSQISPHFIFNVLNSIVYLIRSRSDQAESVTIKLSELMRYMLYSPQEDQIPLDQELDYLGNYISLQQTRFEDDVDIRFERKGHGDTLLIEPMILIPFVENAFKHGVGLLVEPVIDIRSEVIGQQFHFHVSNKIAPESAEDKDGSSGIGLKNVCRRLELLYPKSHELSITQDDGWFRIELRLFVKVDSYAQVVNPEITRREKALRK